MQFSPRTNTSTAIAHMDSSSPTEMNAVLSYAGAFEMQYGISFAESGCEGYHRRCDAHVISFIAVPFGSRPLRVIGLRDEGERRCVSASGIAE